MEYKLVEPVDIVIKFKCKLKRKEQPHMRHSRPHFETDIRPHQANQ